MERFPIILKNNKFILFQHFIDELKRTTKITSIIAKTIRYSVTNHRNLPQLIDHDMLSVIIIDNETQIAQNFTPDLYCRFHRIRFLCSWVDVIHDKRGFSEPAFTSLTRVATGFRT